MSAVEQGFVPDRIEIPDRARLEVVESNLDVVTVADANAEDGKRHVVKVTGLGASESYLRKVTDGLSSEGHTSYDLEHFIPRNLVVGMRRRIHEVVDAVAQRTQKPVGIFGYSLGGTFALLEQQENPDVDTVVTAGSHTSRLLGIHKREGAYAASLFTLFDPVVFPPLSVNGTLNEHHIFANSEHLTLPKRKEVVKTATEIFSAKNDPETKINVLHVGAHRMNLPTLDGLVPSLGTNPSRRLRKVK